MCSTCTRHSKDPPCGESGRVPVPAVKRTPTTLGQAGISQVCVMLLRDRRGYSMTFWAVFIGLLMNPALTLAIELGRYCYAISEAAKAADAASTEIN